MRTVGVEEELLLVDPAEGGLVARARELLAEADSLGIRRLDGDAPGGVLEHEMALQQVELDTRPHSTLAALEDEVRMWRARASEAARRVDADVAALGTYPLPARPEIVPSDRYRTMLGRFGKTAREHLVCGLHVHAHVDDREEAVAVVDRIRVWLPVLLALSANSPFFQGHDSGYASYRSPLMGRWPSAGPTEPFGSAESYDRTVEEMLRSGVLLDNGMVYFDVRVSSRYPTVEVRVADVCLDVRDTILLAGLVRGLVDTASAAWRNGEPPVDMPISVLRLATWDAARQGLTGTLVDPRTGEPAEASDVVGALFETVRPALAANGDEELVGERLERVLGHGTGATRQHAVHQRSGDLADVVRDAVRVTAGEAADETGDSTDPHLQEPGRT